MSVPKTVVDFGEVFLKTHFVHRQNSLQGQPPKKLKICKGAIIKVI